MYAEMLKKYSDDLAAKLPAPGGGSAGAAAASLGCACLSMVANFTVGKPKYARHEGTIRKVLERSEKLRLEFLNLVDLDVIAYQSKDPRKAMDIPLMTSRLCYEAMKLCLPLAKKGNPNLITDVAVGACLIESAYASACYNVIINLKFIDDPKLAVKVKKELSTKNQRIINIRKVTEVYVGKVIGG
ncbi:MAG: cyclodeaminase/cyclohydrolase family protein [Deltaproteobacteria bacterium]